MAQVALNFEDGLTRFIETAGYETIAEAAYRVGINIPLDCADGACGTCKCLTKSGTFDPGDYIDEALSEEEAEQGYGLACQIRPESDMVIDILASAEACKVEATTYETQITDLSYLSPKIVKLKVKIKDGTVITFLPGQYANIMVPGTSQSRSYSFSNLSGSDEMEFIIRLMADSGVMSDYLRSAKAGETLQITGPLGSFYSREIKRQTLFFAGGTGIAPFIAMLEKLNREGNDQSIKLFYGATVSENIVEVDRLETFTNLNLKTYSCVSNESCDKHPSGYVTQWIHQQELPEELYDIYICGPNAMVDAVKSSLEENKINFENFYTEKFIPTGSLIA